MDLINTPMSRVTCPNVENPDNQAVQFWAFRVKITHQKEYRLQDANFALKSNQGTNIGPKFKKDMKDLFFVIMFNKQQKRRSARGPDRACTPTHTPLFS